MIKMRDTPEYKWMIVDGPKYGWYPFHNEPWHWEYNPDGFKDTFYSNYNKFLENCVGCDKNNIQHP